MTLPCNRPCDLVGDAAALAPFYAQVDAVPDALAGQHPIRRYEYAMALRTLHQWELNTVRDAPLQIADIGGAGSQFWRVLKPCTTDETPILVIDAKAPSRVWADGQPVQYWSETVESFAERTGGDQFHVLTCISVLEHVPQVRSFLQACHILLKPGGLLVATVDYWDADGPDTAHFHWMRERIYNAETVRTLLQCARGVGFRSFGGANWAYPGHQLYDYSVASIALVKK